MPADDRLRFDDHQGVQNARRNPIEAGKNEAIEVAEGESLDAQREACEAYIVSQRHAGWVALASMYDDEGLSGGTMERPALKRLLEDIEASKVQIVVVYKVVPDMTVYFRSVARRCVRRAVRCCPLAKNPRSGQIRNGTDDYLGNAV